MIGVGVVVLSYNRPKWLAEALASIKGARQIVGTRRQPVEAEPAGGQREKAARS